MGQESFHQKAGQTYKESFKLDIGETADGVLNNKEEPETADVLGTNRETCKISQRN